MIAFITGLFEQVQQVGDRTGAAAMGSREGRKDREKQAKRRAERGVSSELLPCHVHLP